MNKKLRDATLHCLSERQLLLSVSSFERVVFGWLVPFLVLFGLMGNLINLTFLLASQMKTRSNTLLASLALADIFFLLFLLPHSLAHYRFFEFNNLFRQFYFASKMHLIAFLNWASAAAIWLILTICIERLIGTRYPLSVRRHRAYHTHLLIGTIVILTGLLTFYNHFTYDCITKNFCNNTQIHALCFPVDSNLWANPHSLLIRYYVRWSPYINAIFILFFPTLVVIVSNILLIRTLKQRRNFFAFSNESIKKSNGMWPNAGRIVNVSVPSVMGTVPASLTQSTTQARTEQKVTLTVCAIVTCFTLTQAPSAIVNLSTGFFEIKDSEYKVHLTTLTTLMIVIGKSLNFVLFCLSSANFRQRLINMLKNRFYYKAKKRRHSQNTELIMVMSGVRQLNIAENNNTNLKTLTSRSSPSRNSTTRCYSLQKNINSNKCCRTLSLNNPTSWDSTLMSRINAVDSNTLVKEPLLLKNT